MGNEARKSESLEPQGYKEGLSWSQERPQRGLGSASVAEEGPCSSEQGGLAPLQPVVRDPLTGAQDMGEGDGAAGLGVHCRGRCSCQEGPSWGKGLWAGVLTPVPTLRLPRVLRRLPRITHSSFS